MSKIVKIPDCMKPDFICHINGREYSYPAGAEMEVPDEVADLIEHHMNHRADLVPGLPPSGSASDWNAMINKPFYSETTDVVLLDSETFDTEQEEIGWEFSLVAGQSYHIVWNGDEFDQVAKAVDLGGISVVLLGNEAGVGSDMESTGEPYALLSFDGIGTLPIDMTGAESVTVTLSTVQETVHKLDEKYLPETGPFYFDIICTTSGGIYNTAMVSVAKMEEALAAGRMIIAKFKTDYIPVTYLLQLVSYYEDESNPYGKSLTFTGAYSMLLTPQADGSYAVENKT